MIDIAYPSLTQVGEAAWEIGAVSDQPDNGYLWHYWVPSLALLNRHKYRLRSLQDVLDAGTPFLYPIELRWEILEWFQKGHSKNFLSPHIPESVFDALRDGRARLLLFFGHEGRRFALSCPGAPAVESFYDLLLAFVLRHNLPPKSVWLVHGNLSGDEEYRAWKARRNLDHDLFEARPVEPYSWMTQAGRRTHEEGLGLDVKWDVDPAVMGAQVHKKLHISLKPLDRPVQQIYADLPDPSSPHPDPDKLFLCMNRVTRPHRRIMVCLLQRFGALERSLVSFRDEHPEEATFNDPDIQRAWVEVQGKQPLTIDMDLPLDKIAYNLNNFATVSVGEAWPYRRTYLSLVNETHLENEGVFVSEKTWKPMINAQPFILCGTHGSLAYVRSLGFKTFSPIIDESYDDMVDPVARVRHLAQLIASISSLSGEHLALLRQKLAGVAAFNAMHLRTIVTPMERLMDEIMPS